MFRFITSKIFLINLVIAVIISAVAVFQIFKLIDDYTLHGKTISVPNLEGLTIKEVETTLNEKKLRFSILDSVFVEKGPKGVVLDQTPLYNSQVKENRTIYITVSKIIPPKVVMPNVIDLSQRIAIAKLKSYGLKINPIEWKPSEHVGIVLEHKINNKAVIPGELIDEGSSITLVVGSGKGDQRVMAPYLINMTKDEALNKLQESLLSSGIEVYDSSCKTAKDTANARIYKQNPIRSERILRYMLEVR